MARKPSKKSEQAAETAALIKAIEFVNTAQKGPGANAVGLPYQTHTILRARTAQAYDGVLAGGIGIEFAEINTAAHTDKLLAALKRCKAEYSVTQVDGGQLVVKSGSFRAVVDCLNPADLASNALMPDDPVAVINDNIKKGFATLNPLVAENAQHVVTSSLLLQSNTMVATDRILIAEYWHGIHLPPGLVIPKAALTAIVKTDKPLARLGFSDGSVTFWFEDMSWIKTQRHSEAWPDTSHIFNFTPAVEETPKKLREAVEAVAPFAAEGCVWLNHNEVASHLDNATGATHDCKGLPGGAVFGIKRLLDVLNITTHVDWTSSGLGVYFTDNATVRALLSKRVVSG